MERNFTNKLLKLQTLQLAMLECGIRQDAPSLEVTLHAPFPNHHRAFIFATLHYKVKGDLNSDMHVFDPCDNDDTEFNEFVTNCAKIINNN